MLLIAENSHSESELLTPIYKPTCACPAGNGTSFRSNCFDVRFTRQNDTATDRYVNDKTFKVQNKIFKMSQKLFINYPVGL